MIATHIDETLKEWGDRLHYSVLKGKRTRNIRGGGNGDRTTVPKKTTAIATREKITRIINGIPEAMVKISGGGKTMKNINAHIDYISRRGLLELEDENGDLHLGKEALQSLSDAWSKGGIGIPLNEGKRKEAFNIILSMPPGTDRQCVKNASRAFAMNEFDRHQYLLVVHDDESHPHVHLCVKATSRDGIRLNPRKADLQRWREHFAEQLREQGIAANATPRALRGVIQKGEKQAIRHIDDGYKKGIRKAASKITQEKIILAQKEALQGERYENPLKEKLHAQIKSVTQSYGQIARTLASGHAGDKALALGVVTLVKQIPQGKTTHERLVEKMRKPHERESSR